MSLKKIPVTISPFFWLLAAFIGFMGTGNIQGTLIWMVVIIASVLVHEFGHALTALFFGQKVRVQLVAFGGMTERQGPKLKLWQEFLITLNGPLAGLMIAGVAFLGFKMLPENIAALRYALWVAVVINLFWAALNLMPVLPLDGGRLMSIALEGIFGFRGVKMALLASMFIGGGLAFGLFLMRALLPGAIFMLLAFESFRTFKQTMKMDEKDRDEDLQKLLEEGKRDYEQGRLEEAWIKMEQVLEKAGQGILRTVATETMASVLSEQQKYTEAYEVLVPIKGSLDVEGMRLYHKLAYKAGQIEEAIEVGNQSYQHLPSYDTALVNAFCCALKLQVQPAVGWLECAIRDGLPDAKVVVEKPDFDPIRQDPEFKQFMDNL